MTGFIYHEHFLKEPDRLFHRLLEVITWDNSMAARKTVSFGKAYNYSQMSYADLPLLPELEEMLPALEAVIGFCPNNCLVNFYPDGNSKMGYHADRTEGLAPGSGIAIVSLGASRILRFKRMNDPQQLEDRELHSGSLFCMGLEIQDLWLHAVPKTNTSNGRISLTFRQIA